VSQREGEFYRLLGIRITNRRHELGLTQEKLALSLGLSRTSVTNIEAGRQNVVAHTLALFAEQLALTTDELLGLKPRNDGGDAGDYFPKLRKPEAEMVKRALGVTREEAHAQEIGDPQTSSRATRRSRSSESTRSRR
jgi:transcriptional regulator with XRE-family HTH domain